MQVSGLFHFTLCCDEAALPALKAFYERALGLEAGPRPALRFPGWWLYANGQALVHLYASGAIPPGGRTALNHIAFRGVDLQATRARLAAQGIEFTEAPVPGWPLHQLFMHDPTGLRIEITFDV
jgi:catechol 2,3-dioxygenase-like lactoylglutathione lyase family enzyme